MINFLQSIFNERRARNPKYSLRAYARSLKIHSATLSALLSGKRPLSTKQAVIFLDRLGISDENQRLQLLGTLLNTPAPAEDPYVPLDLERFAVIRDWEHTAVLGLLSLDPRADEMRMARRLRLPVSRLQEALSRLERIGQIEKTAEGWKLASPRHSVMPQVPSADVRESHRQFSGKAIESLNDDPMEIRDFSGMTLTVNPDKMPQIRDAIASFRRRLCRIADDEKSREVYRLNIQFFPLSRGDLS